MCGPGVLQTSSHTGIGGNSLHLGYFLLFCAAKLKIIYSYGGNRGDFVLKLGKKKNKLEIAIRNLCLSRLKSSLDGSGTCSAGPELLELGLALGFCMGVTGMLGGSQNSFWECPSFSTSLCPHLEKAFSVLF